MRKEHNRAPGPSVTTRQEKREPASSSFCFFRFSLFTVMPLPFRVAAAAGTLARRPSPGAAATSAPSSGTSGKSGNGTAAAGLQKQR